jgi:hypothetical protein
MRELRIPDTLRHGEPARERPQRRHPMEALRDAIVARGNGWVHARVTRGPRGA